MSDDLKRQIRRIISDQQAEDSSPDTVSPETLEVVLAAPDVEPGDIERALDELVADGTLTETDGRYGLADDE